MSMKTRLMVDIGDTVYISGEETIVKSNRWMGNHKWIAARDGERPGFIRKTLAQNLLDANQARFYK